MNTIGFIGAGNMGSAILRGIAGSDMKPEAELFAYNPTEAKVDALADCGVQKCKSAAEVVEKSRYVFLAIKPQKFEEVLPQIDILASLHEKGTKRMCLSRSRSVRSSVRSLSGS